MLAWLALTFSLVIAPSSLHHSRGADTRLICKLRSEASAAYRPPRHRTIRYKAVGFEYAAMVEHALKPLL